MNHCTPDNHWECPVKHYDDTLRKSQIYRATYNQPNRQVVPTERRSVGSQKGLVRYWIIWAKVSI